MTIFVDLFFSEERKRDIKKMKLLFFFLFFLRIKSLKYNNLIWYDEFNSKILKDDWIFEIGGSGWGSHELQFYKKENIFLSDGNLIIQARKEHFGGKKNNYLIDLLLFLSFLCCYFSLCLLLLLC